MPAEAMDHKSEGASGCSVWNGKNAGCCGPVVFGVVFGFWCTILGRIRKSSIFCQKWWWWWWWFKNMTIFGINSLNCWGVPRSTLQLVVACLLYIWDYITALQKEPWNKDPDFCKAFYSILCDSCRTHRFFLKTQIFRWCPAGKPALKVGWEIFWNRPLN